MTSELDNSYLTLASKIGNLRRLIGTIAVEDFPISDGEQAVKLLAAQAAKLSRYLALYNESPEDTQLRIVQQVQLKITSLSTILGVLARANTMRNPFELHRPFKELSQQFFSDEIFLILSSEWNYVPFTYPMSIQDLPSFIVIGMPASESESVLIFPAAGHELGHSVWFKNEIAENFSKDVRTKAEQEIQAHPEVIEELFPQDGKDQADIFGQYVNEMMVSAIVTSCMLQIEELFCDFIAIGVFGRSYLSAFRYLIIPGGYRTRPSDYPAQADRATAINTFAARLDLDIPHFERAFENERNPKVAYDIHVVKFADSIREALEPRIQDVALSSLRAAGVTPPNRHLVESTVGFFRIGTPTVKDVGLGELVEAAWVVFGEKFGEFNERASELVEIVSDLVLKSAEAREFMRLTDNAE